MTKMYDCPVCKDEKVLWYRDEFGYARLKYCPSCQKMSQKEKNVPKKKGTNDKKL